MKILTLLTDFGIKDSYVAEMKGVLYSFVPDINVIDITHEINPQNVKEASFVLLNSYKYFPDDTLHIVVVDPGVGTDRDILYIKTNNYHFIGPDNGVLFETVLEDGIKQMFSIDVKKLYDVIAIKWKSNSLIDRITSTSPSNTFHGRDVFAPLAAFIMDNGNIDEVSVLKEKIINLTDSKPEVENQKIKGEIIYIDHFGNLITNISFDLLKGVFEDLERFKVYLYKNSDVFYIGKIKNSYGFVKNGSPVALVNSRGYLEIAINGGNASNFFGTGIGSKVEVKINR